MGHRPVRNDDPAMKGERARNESSGRMRQKRSDTEAGTLEKEYGVQLDIRSDTTLRTMRQRTGETSVEKVIEKLKK
jgi:hypothetical protein